jgi:hypothetical protein
MIQLIEPPSIRVAEMFPRLVNLEARKKRNGRMVKACGSSVGCCARER